MFQNIIKFIGGDPHKREVEKCNVVVAQINSLEMEYEKLSNEELRAKTTEFRRRVAEGETLDEILPEAFAAVREASKRTIGLRHYDVQMIGGMTLHSGKIAEMRTGEGKTLVATLPMYLNALTGKGVHLVTVNDYLARRDARWMTPVYNFLGLSVGVLQMAARTDNGQKAFIVDLEKTSNQEDQNQLRLVSRKEAYQADLTYGTNSEFGFDYLRDNLSMTLEERVQRDHYFAIVDEVDNILIDEARTPLIISGPASENAEWYVKTAQLVRQLQPEDYEVSEKDRNVSLTEVGEMHVEELLGQPLRDPERPEDITPEQARLLGFLEQALRAQHLYRRNKDYLVQAGKVVIVDEFTGRLMPGRRWSEGLHQAVEAKEGVRVEPESITYATITLQNYFRMYEKLAGMTGTALTEAEEFSKIYKLEVLPIPMNLEYVAAQKDSALVDVKAKDEQGYEYYYYTRRDDDQRQPIFYRRKDYTDVVYRTEEAKVRAITQEIIFYHSQGRPILVGTTSVEHSERLSLRLQAENIRRLAQTMIIRQAWMEKNNVEVLEKPVEELQQFNGALDAISAGDLRPTARNLGISLNPEDPANLPRLQKVLGLSEEYTASLLRILQAGIPHEVLNARKHDEESQIIARAGAFGSVTIATNMAGRGVDIKLGGDLPEQILSDTNRVLGRTEDDPYDMTNDQRYQALKALAPDQYGIYEESVKAFLRYVDEMKRVRELGGLHVIGSERHEARRIDNQLRGRATRQGDPGSSRFFLSLEDELMRLFGGQQVESLWKRIFFDESLPLEMRILGRLVEQSQGRVEGANFDVRKHLLEYDDVLNAQRKRIYSQRDMAFTKADLTDDVLEMLRTQLNQRIPVALKDEEGPWKLLAFLEEIQPAFEYEGIHYPSFTLRLLQDEVLKEVQSSGQVSQKLQASLLSLAERTLQAEKEHILRSAQTLLERTQESQEKQEKELFETLDTFVDGLGEPAEEEEGSPALRAQDLLNQLSALVHAPLKLNSDQLSLFPEGDRAVVKEIRHQISEFLMATAIMRLILTFERRLEENLNLRPAAFQGLSWVEVSEKLLDLVEETFVRREEHFLGKDGEIARSLEAVMSSDESQLLDSRHLVQYLLAMTRGTRLAFDSRTHRKGTREVTRLKYQFLVARLLEDSSNAEITDRILTHLEDGLEVLQKIRGVFEWTRLFQNGIRLGQLSEILRDHLIEKLGRERFTELSAQDLNTFSDEDRQVVQAELGWYMQNEIYRELLLRVISEQWVEYLTQMEALRVSIGMEAYAQRDPLVQYKARASELFKELLANIRMGVLSRVFTYQARHMSTLSTDREPLREPLKEVSAVAEPSPKAADNAAEEEKRKKRRHRH